jgi:dephospho-CoA kinase
VKRALVIALTGGIASGKSAVASRFVQRGVPVFDADHLARELVAPGQAALADIVAAFPDVVLTPAGELDRASLRSVVFNDAAARKQLEAILHPRIRARLIELASSVREPYCLLAIPLFVECRSDYDWVDRVLVTDAPRNARLERVMRRPGIDAATAKHMLDAQVSSSDRLALADDAIDTTGPIAALDNIVARLHQRFLDLASPA